MDKALADASDGQISLTDPDAREGAFRKGGLRIRALRRHPSLPGRSGAYPPHHHRAARAANAAVLDECLQGLRPQEPLHHGAGKACFGTIKAWTGPCHFLTRRLTGVRTEMALNVLAYNMKRMIALAGIKALMAAVPE